MQAEKLRSHQDLELYRQLLDHDDVRRVNNRIEKREAEGPMGTRRHLLATSVRLSRNMSREVHKTADACIERLQIDIPLELYVYASPTFNAACVKPEEGRLFIMFSSSLLEGFNDSEFRFVMGHELGHYLYGHHDIPIGYIMRGGQRPDPRLALQLSTWSRYAEVSADRAGAHCAKDFHGVASALFKLASGLTGSTVQFDLDEFLAQVDDMQIDASEPGQGSPSSDWFMTHPFSPLRVRALQLFHRSELAINGGEPVETLEHDVQKLMGLMEQGYLEARDDASEAMRRLLFAGALIVADAHDNVSAEEIAVFEKYFGPGSHSDKLNLDKLRAELPARIESVKQQTSTGQRMQIMHDLGRIACADGHNSPKETALLRQIATELGLSAEFVDKTSCQIGELD